MRSVMVQNNETFDPSGAELSIEHLLGLADDASKSKSVYRITDLAAEFNVSLRSLRFYEQRGLLHPERRGVTRLYSADDHRRLRLVLLGKRLGFSLTEIGQLMKTYLQTASKHQRSQGLRVAFEHQRSVLQTQRDELEASMTALNASLAALSSSSIAKL